MDRGGWEEEGEWETLGEKEALGRRLPVKERQEKKKSGGIVSLSRESPATGAVRFRRGAKKDGARIRTEGEGGGEIEEEGFVAERGFQRSQLLDASRAAGGTGRAGCRRRAYRHVRVS